MDGQECSRVTKTELPDYLRAYAAFKPNDIDAVIRKQLPDADVIVRATAAGLFADLPPKDATCRRWSLPCERSYPELKRQS